MAISVKVMHRPAPESTSYLRAALSGMALTFKHMVNPAAVTQQYPEEQTDLSPRWRGTHRMEVHADGRPKCVACIPGVWRCSHSECVVSNPRLITLGSPRSSFSRSWSNVHNPDLSNRFYLGPQCLGCLVAVGPQTHHHTRYVVYLRRISFPSVLY